MMEFMWNYCYVVINIITDARFSKAALLLEYVSDTYFLKQAFKLVG